MAILRILEVIFIASIFLIGWFAHAAIASDSFNIFQEEQPLNISIESIEKAYPGDWVEEEKIRVYDQGVVLDVQDAEWATFVDTHSMEPTLGARSNAIQVIPTTPEQIKEGDIISYRSRIVDGTIIHRVNHTAVDEQGWYAVTKGDNNSSVDPERVRFEQIERVVIAIVY